MMRSMNDEQMTTKEAAALLRVTRQGVHDMAKRADVAPVDGWRDASTPGTRRRYHWLKSDILRLGERRREYLRKVLDQALGGPTYKETR